MDKSDIKISQSLIKAMRFDENEVPQVCPMFLKMQYIHKIEKPPTLSMQYGNYFETRVLGANRDGERTDQLPLTPSTQKKTADHIRIDDMAHEFLTNIVPSYMLDLSMAHVTLDAELPGIEFDLIAHLDLVSPILDPTIDPDKAVKTAIIDTKLTQDLSSTHGDFSWGQPEKMNHLQAVFYDMVWELKFGERVPFYYIVCEYGPGKRWVVIRKKVTDGDREEASSKILLTNNTLIEWASKQRFPIAPNYQDCTNCPIKDSCEGYRIGRSVRVV